MPMPHAFSLVIYLTEEKLSQVFVPWGFLAVLVTWQQFCICWCIQVSQWVARSTKKNDANYHNLPKCLVSVLITMPHTNVNAYLKHVTLISWDIWLIFHTEHTLCPFLLYGAHPSSSTAHEIIKASKDEQTRAPLWNSSLDSSNIRQNKHQCLQSWEEERGNNIHLYDP